MRPRRIHPKKLGIQRVRKPRQRMPVGGVVSSKGPFQCVPTETSFYLRILSDVVVVVKIDESIVPNWQIGKYGQQNQGKREDECPLAWGRKQFAGLQRSFGSCDLSCSKGHGVGFILSCKKSRHCAEVS